MSARGHALLQRMPLTILLLLLGVPIAGGLGQENNLESGLVLKEIDTDEYTLVFLVVVIVL